MSAPIIDTIFCADATQLIQSWPSGFCDVLVCDPPYGNATAYGQQKRRIAGDDNPLVGLQVVAACHRLLKRNATAYVFAGPTHLGFLEHFFLKYSPFRIREILVWDKGHFGFGSVFRRRYENILVLEKGSPRYRQTSIPTVLNYPRADTTDHPHAKPLALLERLIIASSDPGGLVIDPFAGIGSTCLAAQNTGRRFVGVELDSGYAAIARARLEASAKEAA